MKLTKTSIHTALIGCLFLLPMAANAKPKEKIYINRPIVYTTSNTPMGSYDSSVSHIAFRAHSDTQAKGEIRLTIVRRHIKWHRFKPVLRESLLTFVD